MIEEVDPDPSWVAELSGARTDAVETAISEAAREHRLFTDIAREQAKVGRGSYGEIDAPLELQALVRLLRPKQVVEVGVSSGVSSAYLLNGLEKNGSGTLHSVDRPSFPRSRKKPAGSVYGSWTLPAGRSPGWAVPFRLRLRWDLRLGDKAEALPLLRKELPPVQLFLYDVPHEERDAEREFATLDPLLSDGGVVIVDHGPGGGLCEALAGWAKKCGGRPVHRSGSGLYGMRHPGHRRLPGS